MNEIVFSLWIIEIAKVRSSLFHINGVEKKPLVLPEAEGPITSRQEKVYVPVEEHPEASPIKKISYLIILWILITSTFIN